MAARMSAMLAEARWRGFWGTVRAVKLNKMGTMHCFVGEDKLRNRFFEDKTETYGRDRWVEYVDDRNPDSLKITPEWHAWLHHNTDAPPSEAPLPKPTYQVEETGNTTGTQDAYYQPTLKLSKEYHGTAGEKYEPWSPKSERQTPKTDGQDVLDLK